MGQLGAQPGLPQKPGGVTSSFLGRGGKRKKKIKEGGRGEGRGKRENVNREREEGKRLIKGSFCGLQIFFHVFFSLLVPLSQLCCIQQRTQQHQSLLLPEEELPAPCAAFCASQRKMPHGGTFQHLLWQSCQLQGGLCPRKGAGLCSCPDRQTDRQTDPALPGMERGAGNGLATLPWVTGEPGTLLGQPVSVSPTGTAGDGWG